MEIIKHGCFYNKDSEVIICKECNCNISISLDDVHVYKNPKKVKYCKDFYDGIYTYTVKFYYYFVCPECGEDILISDDTYKKLQKYRKCNSYKSDADKIDEFLDYFYKEIHNPNSSLFNHKIAYREACLYLKDSKNNRSDIK